MSRIEDYALIGDLQTAALVDRRGSIDWLCFPRFDSGACFAALLGNEDNGRWLLAPARPAARLRAATSRTRSCSRRVCETDEGAVRVLDFMPPRDEAPDVVRIVEGIRGSVHMRSELVIRFDYGHIVPWVRNVDGTRLAVAGADALAFHTPATTRGRDMRTISEVVVEAGERVPFVLTWYPSHRDAAGPGRLRARPRRNGELLARVARAAPGLAAGRVAGRRGPLPDGAEGADVRADRRDRRGPDDLAARVDRRRAELGLSLLLAARRDVDAAHAAQRRPRRRGGALATVAAARGRRRPGRPPDHVRRRRRAAADRVRAAVARRLRGVGSGPRRQRGERAGPARCLRRGDGRALPGAGARPARRAARLGAPAGPAPLSRRGVAEAGRGYLGDPRRTAPLRPLEGDGLGCIRPRRAQRRDARSATGPSTAGGRCATRSTTTCARRASTRRSDRSPSRTAHPSWTRACSCFRSSASCRAPTRASAARSRPSSGSSCRTASCSATAPVPASTAYRPARACSCRAPSGSSTASSCSAVTTTRSSSSTGCSRSRTTSGSCPRSTTRRRSACSGTSRRRSPHLALVNSVFNVAPHLPSPMHRRHAHDGGGGD